MFLEPLPWVRQCSGYSNEQNIPQSLSHFIRVVIIFKKKDDS